MRERERERINRLFFQLHFIAREPLRELQRGRALCGVSFEALVHEDDIGLINRKVHDVSRQSRHDGILDRPKDIVLIHEFVVWHLQGQHLI